MPFELDPNVVFAAVAGLTGTLIGGLISLITARREYGVAALREREAILSHQLLKASEQVAAFHALENAYAVDLAASRGVAPRTIKTEYRNRVEALGYPRPRWTEDRAREAYEAATNMG
jgi:hypothetical protein